MFFGNLLSLKIVCTWFTDKIFKKLYYISKLYCNTSISVASHSYFRDINKRFMDKVTLQRIEKIPPSVRV